MAKKPLGLLMAGVALFVVGFAIGQFNIDPLSAWIGTTGLAITLVAVGWIIVQRVRSHRGSNVSTTTTVTPERS
jgi:hypothetical protein